MITPLHYSLSLDPHLEERRFAGDVSIDVDCGEGPRDRIVLDASGLEIDEAAIDGQPAVVQIAGDRLSIVPAAPIHGSRATVRLTFRGRMHEAGRGFFRSGACAVTQLQPVHARRLFPCFDDPRYKTTFDLTITVSASHTAVTNAPLVRDEIDGDRRRMTFARSASIPTHLLGFAIGPFHVTTLDEGDVPFRFFSLESHGGERSLLETARDLLRFHSEFLGVRYPWPKLDLVAVPEYEAAGIETTSVLYFRESAILLDNDASALRRRQVATLVAHELGHQWFGSLVTPSSWADLWLSEGFATWLAAKAVDDPGDVRSIRAAMASDSSSASRALRATGRSADELHELYDEIAYWKGASILRMLEAWLGAETFRSGVRLYLQRHAGGHAASSDLWAALEEVARQSVAFVRPFVDRPGVPSLRFHHSDQTVRIEQLAGEQPIPVTMKAGLQDGAVETRRLLVAARTTEVRLPENVRWVFGNAGGAGYYRCSYEDVHTIPPSLLSATEAATLLCDVWDELGGGTSDVLVYLRIADSMNSHAAIAPLARAHLLELAALLADGARRDPFARWIENRFPAVQESRVEDGTSLSRFEKLLADPGTRASAWSELKANWEDLRRNVVSFGGRGAIAALAAVSDRAMRDDIATFFAAHAPAGAERTLRQTLERIDGRIRFREREQLAFDAWLTRQRFPDVKADDALRQVHALLNVLSAGFHGALLHRRWLQGLGLTPPGWMQPESDLAQVVTALERRLIGVFAGVRTLDDPLVSLGARLQEDLLASSDLTARLLNDGPESSAQAARALSAVLARQGVVFERLLQGAIAFTDLFGDHGTARSLRIRRAATEQDRARIRMLTSQVGAGEASDDVRRALWNECAPIPSLQRSQAADVAALVHTVTLSNRQPPRERDS